MKEQAISTVRAVHYRNPKKYDTWLPGQVATVVRRCPRCGRKLYHQAKRLRGHRAEMHCADCGHGWIGRLKRVEVE